MIDWIKVEDSLPPKRKGLFYSDTVLLHNKDGETCLGIYRHSYGEWYLFDEQATASTEYYDHWAHINTPED